MTSIALEATCFSRDLTQTAQASITLPAPTSTDTPASETNFPDLSNLPPALFFATDPSDDAYLCNSNEPVDDPAVDILNMQIFDPSSLGMNHDGWLARVEPGAPANQTFANDWHVALAASYAPLGTSSYTMTVNEIYAGESMMGCLTTVRTESCLVQRIAVSLMNRDTFGF